MEEKKGINPNDLSFEQIMDYSHRVLINNLGAEDARQFLEQNFTRKDIVSRFQLGYIPENVDYKFSDRLIFPVRNINGKCVAVVGRKMHRDNSAIYLIDKNAEFLYGIFEAAESIKKTGTVFLCEKPLDVLNHYCSGETNCCALLSPSITETHIEALKSLSCKKVVCVFDNDDYGKRKTIETITILKNNSLEAFDGSETIKT